MRVLGDIFKFFATPLLRLAQRNYKFAKNYYIYRRNKDLKRFENPPVIIYQMGKVGSSTIERSLNALDLPMPVFNVHYLSKLKVDQLEKDRRNYFKTEKEGLLKRAWQYQHLREELHYRSPRQKWKIISLTREPIARNISAFFENLELKLIDANGCYRIDSDYYQIHDLKVNLASIDSLIAVFFDRLNHDSPLDFFDRELKKVFGIDVYSSEFPKTIGYKICAGEKADALIIRLEDLNQCGQLAFKEFFNIINVDLISSNIGSQKEYAALYSRFKEKIVFSDQYINKMYQSKYAQHFYDDTEIDSFRSKWTGINGIESVGDKESMIIQTKSDLGDDY